MSFHLTKHYLSTYCLSGTILGIMDAKVIKTKCSFIQNYLRGLNSQCSSTPVLGLNGLFIFQGPPCPAPSPWLTLLLLPPGTLSDYSDHRCLLKPGSVPLISQPPSAFHRCVSTPASWNSVIAYHFLGMLLCGYPTSSL